MVNNKMIPIKDIDKAYDFLDREMSLAEIKGHKKMLNSLMFVKDVLRRSIIDCAIAEGIFNPNNLSESENEILNNLGDKARDIANNLTKGG